MSPERSKYVVEPGKRAEHYTIANCGIFKAGKSHFMGTMPKPGFIQVDPNRDIGHAKAHGLIDYSGGEPDEIWEDWTRHTLPALYNRQPETLGLPADIESVCIDNYTFLFEVMQEAVPIPRTNRGEQDTFKWYRTLRELAKQQMYRIMSLATPFPGDPNRPCYNVAISYHMKAEFRDVPGTEQKVMVGYVPAIEGSFKDKIGSYPGTLLWHEKDTSSTPPSYFCYTKNPDRFKQADDTVGGNRPGHKVLPPKIENTWQALMEGWGINDTD